MAQRADVMPTYARIHWWRSGFDSTNLPSLPAIGDIYIPVHMSGEHWRLAYLDTTRHRIFWLDSLEGVSTCIGNKHSRRPLAPILALTAILPGKRLHN